MDDEDDLFGDSEVGTLGKPLTVNIARLRDALKGGESDPELKEGVVNGISVLANPNDSKTANMGGIIKSSWENIKDCNLLNGVKFVMSRIDYELMASTMTPFVSQDVIQYSMNGYDVDFGKGEDFINFVATDGRRLSLCRFPCTHPKMGDAEGRNGDFILKPLNLFIPGSTYFETKWLMNEYACLIRIQTEDYGIDCWARPIEGGFPNYPRVIPSKQENPEWLNLSAKSARNAFDSIKGLIDNGGYSTVKNQVFINAEDPKHVKLTIPSASVNIDGEASRPMCLRVSWSIMNSAFFETLYTKFMLQSVDKAILAEEPRAVWGTTMFISKIIMPIRREDNADEWGIVDLTKVKTTDTEYLETEGENIEGEDEIENGEELEDIDSIDYGDSLDDDD
jgi:hypothetical protein